MITDPLRIAPAINDGPNCYDLGIHGVINRIGEYSTQSPSIVFVGKSVSSTSDSQSFNVTFQRMTKILPKSHFLGIVKQETRFQILQAIGGDLNFDHALPSECFTWSQSKTLASPESIRARRSSRIRRCSLGTPMSSTRPLRSSQIASINCNFSRNVSFAISATIINHSYSGSPPQSTFPTITGVPSLE